MKFRKSILLGVAAITVSLGGVETSIQAKNLPSFASSYWYKHGLYTFDMQFMLRKLTQKHGLFDNAKF